MRERALCHSKLVNANRMGLFRTGHTVEVFGTVSHVRNVDEIGSRDKAILFRLLVASLYPATGAHHMSRLMLAKETLSEYV